MGCRAGGERATTPEHLQLVTDLGIDYAQGYFLGRPIPATTMLDLAATGGLTNPVLTR